MHISIAGCGHDEACKGSESARPSVPSTPFGCEPRLCPLCASAKARAPRDGSAPRCLGLVHFVPVASCRHRPTSDTANPDRHRTALTRPLDEFLGQELCLDRRFHPRHAEPLAALNRLELPAISTRLGTHEVARTSKRAKSLVLAVRDGRSPPYRSDHEVGRRIGSGSRGPRRLTVRCAGVVETRGFAESDLPTVNGGKGSAALSPNAERPCRRNEPREHACRMMIAARWRDSSSTQCSGATERSVETRFQHSSDRALPTSPSIVDFPRPGPASHFRCMSV